MQSAFYPNFAGQKISFLSLQSSHCSFSETNESLLHTSIYLFPIHSSIMLQSQSVLRDLPHCGLLTRILNGRLNSDIFITNTAHFDLLGFAN